MALPGLIGRRMHNVLDMSVRSFVRLFVCYKTCEQDILKRTILMSVGTSCLLGKGRKRSNLGQEVKGQTSRSHEAEDRFGGLAEASPSTPFGRVGFLVIQRVLIRSHKS